MNCGKGSGDDVLTAQGLSLAFGEAPLFENVDIEIKRGEKIFLIGPNGCGKTSLFKILLGQYRQDEGEVRLGVGVDLGYYEQSQLSLHDNKAVIDEIWDIQPQMTQTEIRSALASAIYSLSISAGQSCRSAIQLRYIRILDSSLERISVKVRPIFSPCSHLRILEVSIPSFSKK